MAARGQVDADTLCRDDRCALGRWLHGPGGARWGRNALFTALMNEHAQFHQAAGEVARAINSGDFPRAEELLGSGSRFSEVSNRTVTAIQHLQRETAPA